MRPPGKPREHFGCLGFGFRFAEDVVLVGDRGVGGENRIFGRFAVCGKPLRDGGGIFFPRHTLHIIGGVFVGMRRFINIGRNADNFESEVFQNFAAARAAGG